MGRLAVLAVVLGLVGAAACGGDGEPASEGASVEGFELASGDVRPGEPLDARYTCDGDNVSPALTWTGVPDGTKELAIVVEDPDAPDGTFTHWLAVGIPSGPTGVPQGVPPLVTEVPGPTPLNQGENDFGEIGYGGPCPPEGETHTYVFRLLAVDRDLGLPPGANRATFDAAIAGHVIAEARLEGVYSRS